jgi:ligand-binding sensor domain-containing protein
MVLSGNYRLFLIITLFSLFIAPLAAIPVNETNITEITPSTASPPPYTIRLFVPTTKMIHSTQIFDQINGPENQVLFATAFGLSTYYPNNSWSTRHINRDNVSQGLLDDYVTAVEYDKDGNLWIGYPAGIQIYNGIYYRTIRDQQMLKDTRIQELQRWGDDIWIATGNAGIHRYRNGEWTWFQPMEKNGPGFYDIRSVALDPVNDDMVIGSDDNGIWVIRSPDDPVLFEQIAQKSSPYGSMSQVKRDPMGGVYLFDDTSVVHYSPEKGFVPTVTIRDLTMEDISINDIAPSPQGLLYIATDNGIFIWKDGAVIRFIGRFEGIGTSTSVRTVNMDAENRLWFATPEYVGYYRDLSIPESRIQVERVTPATNITTFTPNVTSVVTSAPVFQTSGSATEPGHKGSGSFLDPLFQAINAITSRFGFSIFPTAP